jgi:ketosteroid isomerase-like protein
MSQENVEIVRLWYAALSAGPEEARSAVTELFDNEIDYYPIRKFPEAHPCHGPEEVAQFAVQYRETWAHFEHTVPDLIAVGDDRVLARGRVRAEGRAGVQIQGDHYTCVWLRHGRFFRVEDHLTLKGALYALGLNGDTLEAVGLSDQDAHADS